MQKWPISRSSVIRPSKAHICPCSNEGVFALFAQLLKKIENINGSLVVKIEDFLLQS